jgi:hypothetical protein
MNRQDARNARGSEESWFAACVALSAAPCFSLTLASVASLAVSHRV